MSGKSTSIDIAYLAGVSQSTVSRALRGSPTVNEETRKRIEEIAHKLNYTVDKNASNLRTQHSNTIALLFFEDPTPDDSLINPFFLAMLGSITRASAQRGYDLLISFQELSGNWHVTYEDSKKADGIILLGYGDYMEYRFRLEQLVAQGTHFVRWGAVLEGQPGISIGCDNFQGGFDAAKHLLDHGRGHHRPGEQRQADLERRILAAEHQHLVELDEGSRLGRELLHTDDVARGHPILFTAGLDDCVHGRSDCWAPEKADGKLGPPVRGEPAL